MAVTITCRSRRSLVSCVVAHHVRTYGYSESHFYDLDQHESLKKVHCDIDQTTLVLVFHSAPEAVEWFGKLEFENYFVTGGIVSHEDRADLCGRWCQMGLHGQE